ncbi:hypothetical protein [Fontibacillus phaseoli]|uniref:hypothetical protein n=1 Tax=Fontibacillus phaseoli TaxID=1416533 RepID=UPI0015F0F5DC|nr:hypothetical protein [Fontibacillus phaseoli]
MILTFLAILLLILPDNKAEVTTSVQRTTKVVKGNILKVNEAIKLRPIYALRTD